MPTEYTDRFYKHPATLSMIIFHLFIFYETFNATLYYNETDFSS